MINKMPVIDASPNSKCSWKKRMKVEFEHKQTGFSSIPDCSFSTTGQNLVWSLRIAPLPLKSLDRYPLLIWTSFWLLWSFSRCGGSQIKQCMKIRRATVHPV
uniref:Uncharacterized protein n=1 Tax=Sphaerodactylus townsendi TaxID=933632 RepID=A0ACB8EZ41_9SAUR